MWLFFDVPTWPEELKAREELNLAFLKLAEDIGVSYAFPTRTVHVEGNILGGGESPETNG